jgi:CRISPR-associated RAMP protein (TIGR02581 family)
MTDIKRFEKFKSAIFITGKVMPKTPLHVGQGRSLDPLDCDSPVIRDVLRRPYIPGSSFRGVLRSGAEMILRGVAESPEQENRLACWGVQDREKWCSSNFLQSLSEEKKRILQVDRDLFGDYVDHCCLVCRVFGNMEMASKLKVQDLPLGECEIPSTRIKDGIRIDRSKGTVADGGKFDYEVVDPVQAFEMELQIMNPDPEEVGVVIMALDAMDSGLTGIGGKRGAGLGRVSVNYSVSELTFSELMDGGTATAVSEEKIRSFKDSLKSFAEKVLAEGGQ